MSLTIASINVNGLRAAARNGMREWLVERRPDVVTLQEVRAPDDLVAELVATTFGEEWHVAHVEGIAKGRAGVGVVSRRPHLRVSTGEADERLAGTGRWLETDLALDDGAILTVISAYAHTGDAADGDRMAEKLGWFEAATDRIRTLRADGRHVLLTGDLNVAHRDIDLKNWKGNRGEAGCLPDERAHFDRWFDELGLVDVARRFAGDVPGPYTWWSFRGRAFDNDSGWRIDYQIASAELAARATGTSVDRALTYDSRWSDHAPLVVDYDV